MMTCMHGASLWQGCFLCSLSACLIDRFTYLLSWTRQNLALPVYLHIYNILLFLGFSHTD